MSDNKIYDVLQKNAASSHSNIESYRSMYQDSIDNPEAFWAEQAKLFLDWIEPWDAVMNYDYQTGHIRWFE
ncbi:MAG: acetyl-coenzyme A synthetase N-terminal domain-containing protein, partial [Methylococcaceae bacterium]